MCAGTEHTGTAVLTAVSVLCVNERRPAQHLFTPVLLRTSCFVTVQDDVHIHTGIKAPAAPCHCALLLGHLCTGAWSGFRKCWVTFINTVWRNYTILKWILHTKRQGKGDKFWPLWLSIAVIANLIFLSCVHPTDVLVQKNDQKGELKFPQLCVEHFLWIYFALLSGSYGCGDSIGLK